MRILVIKDQDGHRACGMFHLHSDDDRKQLLRYIGSGKAVEGIYKIEQEFTPQEALAVLCGPEFSIDPPPGPTRDAMEKSVQDSAKIAAERMRRDCEYGEPTITVIPNCPPTPPSPSRPA